MNFYFGIFQKLCLKVSEDVFYGTPPRVFGPYICSNSK